MNIPDYAIERLARCMLPLIQKYYESEDGQKELSLWQETIDNGKAGIVDLAMPAFVVYSYGRITCLLKSAGLKIIIS